MGVTNDLYVFFSFLVAGMFGGVIFDFFRGMRKNIKVPNILVCIEDVIFWVSLGMIAIITAQVFNQGEIRVHLLVSMLLGGIIYFFTFGKFIYKLFSTIFRYIYEFINMIKRVFFQGGKNEAKTENI